MLKKLFELAVGASAGGVLGIIGAAFWVLFGGGFVGFLVGLAVVGGLILFLKSIVANDEEKNRLFSVEQAKMYNAMVANGMEVTYGDKPWKLGSRIDPKTGLMIEPGV